MFKKKPQQETEHFSQTPPAHAHPGFGSSAFTGGLALPKVHVDFGLQGLATPGQHQAYPETYEPAAHVAQFAPEMPAAPLFDTPTLPQDFSEFDADEPDVTPGWEHAETFSDVPSAEPIHYQTPEIQTEALWHAVPPAAITHTHELPPSALDDYNPNDNWDLSEHTDADDDDDFSADWMDMPPEAASVHTPPSDPLSPPQPIFTGESNAYPVEPLWSEAPPQASQNDLWDRPALDWGSENASEPINAQETVDAAFDMFLPSAAIIETTAESTNDADSLWDRTAFDWDDEAPLQPQNEEAKTQSAVMFEPADVSLNLFPTSAQSTEIAPVAPAKDPLWDHSTIAWSGDTATTYIEPLDAAFNMLPTAEPTVEIPAEAGSLWDRPTIDWGTTENTPTEQATFETLSSEEDDDDFDVFSDDEDDTLSASFNAETWHTPNPVSGLESSTAYSLPTIPEAALSTGWENPIPTSESYPSWASNPEEQVQADVSFDDFTSDFVPPTMAISQPTIQPESFQPVYEPISQTEASTIDISEPFIQEHAPGPGASAVYEGNDPLTGHWSDSQTPNEAFSPATEGNDYWQQVAQSQASYSDWSQSPVAGHQVMTGQDGSAQFLDTVHDTLYPQNAFDAAGDEFNEASALLFPETAGSMPSGFSTQNIGMSTATDWDTPFLEQAPPPVWTSHDAPTQTPVVSDELSAYYDMNGPWHDPSMPVEAEVSFDDTESFSPSPPSYPQPAPQVSMAPGGISLAFAAQPDGFDFPIEEPAIARFETAYTPATLQENAFDSDDDEDWSLNFDEQETETLASETEIDSSSEFDAFDDDDDDDIDEDIFDFDSNWADDDLEQETTAYPQPVAEARIETLHQPEAIISQDLSPSIISMPVSESFLTENEPFAFANEEPLFAPQSEAEESFLTETVTFDPMAGFMPEIQEALPEQHNEIPLTAAYSNTMPATPPAHSDSGLNILHSLELSAFHRLLLVRHQQYFALMGQVGPEDEANVNVLKLFANNPLTGSADFLAVKEGQSAHKDIFIVKIGSWQAILAVSAEYIQLQSEITP